MVNLQGDGRALSAEAPTLPARETSSTPASVSPSPTPTPIREPKGPNPVRRFFSWAIQPVTRLFKKPYLGCSLPPTVNVRSSTAVITVCPVDQSSPTCSESSDVKLSADVSDDGDGVMLFTWEVTAGRLKGEGRNVTWDLSGVGEGTYTATVEVNDGYQHTASAATSVTVARCESCTTIVVPCPTISVSCPSTVDPKQPVVFEAIVIGGPVDLKPTYRWSVVAGKILSGQGTSKIMVDVSEAGSKSITAVVYVGGGYNPSCPVQASCSLSDFIRGDRPQPRPQP